MISTPVGIYARIRRVFEAASAAQDSQDDVTPGLTQQYELLTAQGAPTFSELTRAGLAFKVQATAAVAAVVALPTTAQMFAIYNNEPDTGKTIVIDWVAALNAVSTAVVAQATLIALVGQVRETAPADAAMIITKMNGNGVAGFRPSVLSILSATALPATTGLVTNWFPLGPSVTKPSAVATPGYGLWQRPDGGIMVAPGRYFAMHVLANVVGETFIPFIGFHVKQYNNLG